ncbi:MAG: hypothetical protein ACXIVQ_14930 [Acidimicrobiales bacterium]
MFIPILVAARTIAALLLALGIIPGPAETPTPTPVVVTTPTTAPTTPTTTPTTEPAQPGKLVVDSGTIDLPANTYTGSFDLTNTGGQPVHWEWIRGPEVHTATPSGTLAAGQSVTVHFELDPAGFAAGPNLSATCITYDGGALDVWITATKVSVGGPTTITS